MQKEDKKKILAQYKNRTVLGGIVAVKNNANGKVWIEGVLDIEGRRNRFAFVKTTGSAVPLNIKQDWQKYGADAFSFEVFEELKKKDSQTKEEFAKDIEVLKALWMEKFKREELY
jgi:hypothetical protein